MNLKLLSAVALSAALFSCGSKQDQAKNGDAQSQTKKVLSAVSEKPLPSVKSLSDGAFVPDRVFFKFDDASIQDEYSAYLITQAAYIKAELLKNSNLTLVIEGNCDERGGVEYNIALGQKRANAVKDYLVSQGIDSNKIKTVSFGKERKLVEGTSAIAYLQNRAALTKIEK